MICCQDKMTWKKNLKYIKDMEDVTKMFYAVNMYGDQASFGSLTGSLGKAQPW